MLIVTTWTGTSSIYLDLSIAALCAVLDSSMNEFDWEPDRLWRFLVGEWEACDILTRSRTFFNLTSMILMVSLHLAMP